MTNERQQLTLPLDPQTIELIKSVASSSSARVSNPSSISIPHSTPTKVTFSTINFISGNLTFNTSTNQFTVTSSGKYLVTGAVLYDIFQSTTVQGIFVYVNGVATSQIFNVPSSAVGSLMITDTLNLNANDTIALYLQNGGTSGTLDRGQTFTYLTVLEI